MLQLEMFAYIESVMVNRPGREEDYSPCDTVPVCHGRVGLSGTGHTFCLRKGDGGCHMAVLPSRDLVLQQSPALR